MLFAKFVTNMFLSPGSYGKIDYSLFGEPIEEDADPHWPSQCAKGIHVIPLSENIDFANVIFTDTIIILEAEESDIAFRKGDGKVRLRKATPLREATVEERDMIRTAACKNAGTAHSYALAVDKYPSDQTRDAACTNAKLAFDYACDVDKAPLEQTRNAVCEEAQWAYLYARYVDNCPSKQTRDGACKEAKYAYWYATYVDNCPSKQTRDATIGNYEFSNLYTKGFGKV